MTALTENLKFNKSCVTQLENNSIFLIHSKVVVTYNVQLDSNAMQYHTLIDNEA